MVLVHKENDLKLFLWLHDFQLQPAVFREDSSGNLNSFPLPEGAFSWFRPKSPSCAVLVQEWILSPDSQHYGRSRSIRSHKEVLAMVSRSGSG